MGVRGPGAKPVRRLPKPLSAARKPGNPAASRADRLIAWIETLVITSGPLAAPPGAPPRLVQVPEFQRQIIRDLYRTDEGGRRIVRQAVVSMPRRNGKSYL